MMTTSQKVATSLLACLILVYCVLSAHSFVIAHARGDQLFYTALAMKLDHGNGWSDYNLRYVDMHRVDGFYHYVRGESEKGSVLAAFEERGVHFYSEPLFHTPPLFPQLLWGSHRWLAAEDPYQLLATPVVASQRMTREGIALTQLPFCLVPILGGVGLILITYLLGRMLFNDWIGLAGAVLLTFSPAFLLSSQRVWADTVLAMLIGLAIALACRYRIQPKLILLILSGVAFGLALLTKITAILAALPLLVCFWQAKEAWTVRCQRWAIYVAVVAVITVPWYLKVYQVYGTPIYAPQQVNLAQTHQYFIQLKQHPWYTYLVGLPYQVPVFGIGYIILGLMMRPSSLQKPPFVLGIWAGWFILALTYITHTDPMLGPEQRYLLPAYPALALLAAAGIERSRCWLTPRIGRWPAWMTVGCFICISLGWVMAVTIRSLPMDDILLPF